MKIFNFFLDFLQDLFILITQILKILVMLLNFHDLKVIIYIIIFPKITSIFLSKLIVLADLGDICELKNQAPP